MAPDNGMALRWRQFQPALAPEDKTARPGQEKISHGAKLPGKVTDAGCGLGDAFDRMTVRLGHHALGNLNSDCLRQVVAHLGVKDRRNLAQTCQGFRYAAPDWRQIPLANAESLKVHALPEACDEQIFGRGPDTRRMQNDLGRLLPYPPSSLLSLDLHLSYAVRTGGWAFDSTAEICAKCIRDGHNISLWHQQWEYA